MLTQPLEKQIVSGNGATRVAAHFVTCVTLPRQHRVGGLYSTKLRAARLQRLIAVLFSAKLAVVRHLHRVFPRVSMFGLEEGDSINA